MIHAGRALRGIVAHLRDEHDYAQALLGDAAERLTAAATAAWPRARSPSCRAARC